MNGAFGPYKWLVKWTVANNLAEPGYKVPEAQLSLGQCTASTGIIEELINVSFVHT